MVLRKDKAYVCCIACALCIMPDIDKQCFPGCGCPPERLPCIQAAKSQMPVFFSRYLRADGLRRSQLSVQDFFCCLYFQRQLLVKRMLLPACRIGCLQTLLKLLHLCRIYVWL